MSEVMAGQGTPEPKCPRCGELFYDPVVMLKDARQHAFEWEGIANRMEAERDAYRDGVTTLMAERDAWKSKYEQAVSRADEGRKE